MNREQKINKLIEKEESMPQKAGKVNYIYLYNKGGIKRMDNYGGLKWHDADFTKWAALYDNQIDYHFDLV